MEKIHIHYHFSFSVFRRFPPGWISWHFCSSVCSPFLASGGRTARAICAQFSWRCVLSHLCVVRGALGARGIYCFGHTCDPGRWAGPSVMNREGGCAGGLDGR